MKNFWIGLSLVAVLSACDQRQVSLNIVPYPDEMTVGKGRLHLAGTDIRIDPAFDSLSRQAVAAFAERLSEVTGKTSRLLTRADRKGLTFRLDSLLEQEEYQIVVTRSGAVVSAAGTNGVVYGIQTLSQSLPPAFFGDAAVPQEDWSVPCMTVRDKPRFAYRGLMLDCARHFFSVEEVKRILDVMMLHKLNTFHWHLTDDQGWRLEIKKYPALTDVGAFRNRKSFDQKDDEPYGGYYSQEQVRDIVRYAAVRGITVIPEIEMPGHILSALAAYPQLGCTGGPYKVWLDTGVSQDVLCVGKESSYAFVEDVLTEVMELFPSRMIHIGGDECPTAAWERCPHCQKLVRDAGLQDSRFYKAESYLQSLFTKRILRFLEAHGRTLLGWDEIIEHDLDTTAVVMAWRALGTGFLPQKEVIGWSCRPMTLPTWTIPSPSTSTVSPLRWATTSHWRRSIPTNLHPVFRTNSAPGFWACRRTNGAVAWCSPSIWNICSCRVWLQSARSSGAGRNGRTSTASSSPFPAFLKFTTGKG